MVFLNYVSKMMEQKLLVFFSNSNEKYLIFRAGGATERMRIDSNGNVGIGDTTPSQKLDVNGNVRVDGAIYVADRIYHDGDTNTHIRFDSNDNISLNTFRRSSLGSSV